MWLRLVFKYRMYCGRRTNRCSVWGIYGKLAAGYVILVTNFGMFEFTARGGKL
jgi:hypothetical protein